MYDSQPMTVWEQMERDRNLDHQRRQTAALEAGTSRHPQRQGGGASSVGYAGGQLIGNAAAAVGAYAGTKAGQAHYERTGDLKEAMWLGAIAGRRWMVWTLACVVWCVMWLITFVIFMGVGVDYNDYQAYGSSAALAGYQESKSMFYAWLLSMPVLLILLLVIYWRNVNFSLAKRRTVYYLIQPVAKLLTWFPNWLLYAGFIIVPVTFQYVL